MLKRILASLGTKLWALSAVAAARRVLVVFSLLLSVGTSSYGTQSDDGSQQSLKLYMGVEQDDEAIKEAIRLGHIVPGMTESQVVAAVGKPIRKVRSSTTPAMEHWFYRLDKVHQERLRGRGWSVVRITFRDGRVLRMEGR
jgi:hypothetical protein